MLCLWKTEQSSVRTVYCEVEMVYLWSTSSHRKTAESGSSSSGVNKRKNAWLSLPALVPTLPPKWALLRRPSPPPSAFFLPLFFLPPQAAPTQQVPSDGRRAVLPGGAAGCSVTPSTAASRDPISRRWRGLRQTGRSGICCPLPLMLAAVTRRCPSRVSSSSPPRWPAHCFGRTRSILLRFFSSQKRKRKKRERRGSGEATSKQVAFTVYRLARSSMHLAGGTWARVTDRTRARSQRGPEVSDTAKLAIDPIPIKKRTSSAIIDPIHFNTWNGS